MMELKCGTKIKWCEPSLSIKEGIIVNESHIYSGRTPDNKYGIGIRSDYYDVIESGTGFLYNIRDKAITLVFVDGEWIEYEHSNYCNYYKCSGRYPWKSDDTNTAKDYINYIYGDCKAMYNLIRSYKFAPKKVIFNDPATIVMWQDGTKTIVKRREGEPDDKEKAIMYCILKKLCGGKAPMDRYLKLFLKEEESNEEKEEAGSGKSDWKKPRAGSGSSEGAV